MALWLPCSALPFTLGDGLGLPTTDPHIRYDSMYRMEIWKPIVSMRMVYLPIPLDPKTMKVVGLNSQYMGETTPKNEGNVGSHGRVYRSYMAISPQPPHPSTFFPLKLRGCGNWNWHLRRASDVTKEFVRHSREDAWPDEHKGTLPADVIWGELIRKETHI